MRGRGAALVLAAVVAAALGGCRAAIKDDRPAAGAPREAAVAADLSGLPPLGPPVERFELPAVEERVLPNGLTVLAVGGRALPLVTFSLALTGGMAFDPPGQGGVATLVAELLTKGTTRHSAEELAREIEFLGGEIEGGAGTDFTTVSGEFLSKDLARGLDLFAEVVLQPTFPEEEFRRGRDLALAGILAEREDPSAIVGRCFEAYLYGTHPYGRPGAGTEASLAALDRDDVATFYQRHYGPDGSVLVLVGDAPAATLLDAAERAFGGWRSRAGGQPMLPLPTRVTGRRILLVDKPDAKQAHIRIGNVAIARTDPEYVPALVTGTILGGGFGSRLLDELRVKRSLTYGAWSGFTAYRMPGDFQASTFTKVETTGEALRVALDVLQGFTASGPTGVELARAQSLRTGQYPRQFETAGQLASQLAGVHMYGLPRSDLEEYPGRVMAVTTADVARIAATYAAIDDAAIVVVGPAAIVEPQLAPFGTIDHATPATCDTPGAPSAIR
jgi:predicted Zn-dependent peptidase